MRTIKIKATVDEELNLSAKVPADVPSGTVDVILFVEADDGIPYTPPLGNDSFEQLMTFHKGRSLGDVTLEELLTEGRR